MTRNKNTCNKEKENVFELWFCLVRGSINCRPDIHIWRKFCCFFWCYLMTPFSLSIFSVTSWGLLYLGSLPLAIRWTILHSQIFHHGSDVILLCSHHHWFHHRTLHSNMPSNQSPALLSRVQGDALHCGYLDGINIQCLAVPCSHANVLLSNRPFHRKIYPWFLSM